MPLDEERKDVLKRFEGTRNYLNVKSCDGELLMRIGSLDGDLIEVTSGMKVGLGSELGRLQFDRLYFTNPAQSGKTAVIYVGGISGYVISPPDTIIIQGGDGQPISPSEQLQAINNYGILIFELFQERDNEAHEINVNALTLLEKTTDNWEIRLNSVLNDAIKGADLDPGDIIGGDGAAPGYWKYLFFSNPGGEGKVRFFAARGLPFREPNEDELPVFSNPSGAEGYYGWIGYPPYEGIYWILQQRLNEEIVIRDIVHCGNGHLVALCNSGKVYKSLDWGKTWSYVSLIPRIGDGNFVMDFEPNEIAGDRLVYMVYEGMYFYYYISYDYGETWELTYSHHPGFGAQGPRAIKYLGEGHWSSSNKKDMGGTNRGWMYPVDDGVTWNATISGARRPNAPIFNGGNGLVFNWNGQDSRWMKSVDWGKSFVSAPTVPAAFKCGYIMGDLYIMGASDGHIYKSTTGWQADAFTDCGDLGGTQVKTILRLTIDVFIAGSAGSSYLYVSVDKGDTWIDYGRMSEVNDILKLMSLSSSELLAVVNNARLFKPQE